MSQKKLRVGVVGLGIGRGHVECFLQDERVQLAAVGENALKLRRDGQLTEAFAASVGAKLYPDAVAMIESGDIDAVSLAVTPKHRMVLLEAAARRGLPVLMEKPMAATWEDSLAMARIVRRAGILFMMEYPMRYSPPIAKLRELIDTGVVGPVLSVNAELQTGWNPPAGHWAWDAANGNGLLNEAIIHLYDTTNFVCGNPVEVFAVGRHYFGRTDLEDSAVLTIKYENGSVAVLNGGGLGTNAMAAEPMSMHVFGVHGEALVTGRDWQYQAIRFATRTDQAPTALAWDVPPRFQLMRYTLREFVSCILERRPTACGLEAGLRAQGVVAAMKESIRTGKVAAVRSARDLID
jgi:predicted dehydrogenase